MEFKTLEGEAIAPGMQNAGAKSMQAKRINLWLKAGSHEDNHITKGKLFASTKFDTATDHFNEIRIMGEDGQGTFYKGILTDGMIIAIKKSKVIDAEQVEQFVNEILILFEINHRNMVKLLGFCLESEVPLLEYEFVSNGTLHQYLHNACRGFPMSWRHS
ncbi:wall-associated receptor kinase-like 8 [Syzygium oleosum]|uniref:wall-associated receptor kinase-like 8 n=1 Tax=Syzygium oleosum TaxID=219896 RepID=UPI0011D1EF2B|nr:wall-associated receptor kinase-like 8 [Syzygium oleosum]